MIYPNFVGPSYQSQSLTADQEDLINLFVERIESPGGTAPNALYPTPGVEVLTDTGRSTGRAHLFAAGREFIVNESIFFEVDSDGATTFHGFVAVDTNAATISYNGDGGGQLFITSGGNGYLFVLATNTFSTIAALNGIASMGDALDGYFLDLDANTGTLYISNLLDGSVWATGTMFAQRIAGSDPWIALKVLGPYIWLFGPETTEVWYDAGTSPFPFAKHPSGLIQWGIAAPFSVTVCDTSLVWLGSSKAGNGYVLRASGFSPEVVSTYPVQFAINGYGSVSDAYGDSYNMDGHTFYTLGFPKANRTWCWDVQMGLWHKRATWVPAEGAFSAWRPRCHAFAFGEHRWLDAISGHVYRMSSSLGVDAGGLAIRRVRRAPALVNENEWIFYPGFELDVQPGLGANFGQGVNPQIMMRTSKDGGQIWGTERLRSLGKMGKYSTRVIWNRLGAARRLVVEVAITDPVPFRITGAFLPGLQAPQQRRTA